MLWLRDDLSQHVSDTDETRQQTILIDCRTILHADRYSEDTENPTATGKRPTLSFLPGEGFCIVGWIERTVDAVSMTFCEGDLGLMDCRPRPRCLTFRRVWWARDMLYQRYMWRLVKHISRTRRGGGSPSDEQFPKLAVEKFADRSMRNIPIASTRVVRKVSCISQHDFDIPTP